MAISSYLRDGAYDRFLRKLRRNLAAQAQMLAAVRAYFPAGTEVFAPRGMYFLWIELPPRVDAMHLFGDAMESGVSIAPGPIFSATGGFRRYLRLSTAGRGRRRSSTRWRPSGRSRPGSGGTVGVEPTTHDSLFVPCVSRRRPRMKR